MSDILRFLVPLLAAAGVAVLVGLVPVSRRGGRSTTQRASTGGGATARFATTIGAACGAALIGRILFGSLAAAVACALAAAAVPSRSAAAQAKARLREAVSAWPLVLEETRVRVSGAGQSLPLALFESGQTTALSPYLSRAATTWGISTDFERALATLRDQVADPVTDSVVETLLAVYLAGAVNCDERLSALIADRRDDLDARREADARRAGVDFSRRFVLLVPAAMALVAMFFGSGRTAFATATGQRLLVVAIAFTAACWVWSGHLAQIPERPRVFR